MKRWMSALLAVIMLFGCCGALAEAVEAPVEAAGAVEAAEENRVAEGAKQAEEAGDNLVVTENSATIDGKTVDYTATTGTLRLEMGEGSYDIFFTAYTAKGVEDVSKRPITFAFNGGPGSASLWLHMGLLGPERIDVNPEGMLEKIPAGHRPNAWSILDMTDLVFIDPVGTGYSRTQDGLDSAMFYDMGNDIASVADFIRLYVDRYNRWSSPRYLAGESYGTIRAVGVCSYLTSAYHMSLNGLILVSSANDYAAMYFVPGNETPYISFFPTYAAAAWYHGKVGEAYRNMALEAFLDEARAFAAGDYLSAIYQGTRLSDAQRDDIAARMADFIGLSKEYILENDLRVTMEDFCAELLAEQKQMIGRIDCRYTGPLMDGNIGLGTNDPSSIGISEAFTGAFVDYVSRELNYRTDVDYQTLSYDVIQKWNFDHDNRFVAQEDDIRNCMSANKFLKVWVLSGYYDLATPFFGTEWVFSHLFLTPELQDNLSFSYYPAGHMFYMVESCLERFHEEAKAWYGVE